MSLPQNGWLPQNLKITSTGGYVTDPSNGLQKIVGDTIFDFDDVAGASSYNFMFCPIRFTSDLTRQGINNHYPACGSKITANFYQSYIDLLNGYTGLIPGDVCIGYFTAFDSQGNFSYSQVFQFTVAGASTFPQTAGSMEYCSQGLPIPAPIKGGKKK